MSKGIRRYKSAAAGNGVALGRCERIRMPRAKVLLCCLCGLLAVAIMLGLYMSGDLSSSSSTRTHAVDLTKDKLSHRPSKLSVAQVKRLVSHASLGRLWETHLRPILRERLPGTAGSKLVRQHIISQLRSLSAGWLVETDSFSSPTPHGSVIFSNVLAVLDPIAPRRLLLACHYDSKAIQPPPGETQKPFVGASDSAVPCAMILELVTALDSQLKSLTQQKVPLTLQLVFFDGEEAFQEWTATDSLYGSRHLAERMSHAPHPAGAPHTTLLQAVDLFVLLDLIGAPDPLFVNHFDNTARWFDRLIAAEKRLHKLGLLSSHPSEQSYFRKDVYLGPVQDDHIPFLQRGVPVLHLIATPFPSFWHTLQDTEENMHAPTVENLTKIMMVFLAEYLGL
ncbi:glutaminyl-peptide cyclotransferase-like a [Paramormyrops kingsleyae]|uniref:Glutaminyl-peptide cyclotransferase n=1 Tax=Paramormyrops kingsleyae TaxID=1676925 RepID=A0A3B3SHF9_9TELE|nr:glutaminyl-peptide cyclotransferase-like protein [Paramormyrops kingsleyae]XP_023669469.1 glutaminyl-peptide cyclotransferase-like protein [Paramormyrops kingsleyae]XP_023669470.1 glutaminyl-peptide cyclotransferase-like protein [Paramormyrops kingsleyae]